MSDPLFLSSILSELLKDYFNADSKGNGDALILFLISLFSFFYLIKKVSTHTHVQIPQQKTLGHRQQKNLGPSTTTTKSCGINNQQNLAASITNKILGHQ